VCLGCMHFFTGRLFIAVLFGADDRGTRSDEPFATLRRHRHSMLCTNPRSQFSTTSAASHDPIFYFYRRTSPHGATITATGEKWICITWSHVTKNIPHDSPRSVFRQRKAPSTGLRCRLPGHTVNDDPIVVTKTSCHRLLINSTIGPALASQTVTGNLPIKNGHRQAPVHCTQQLLKHVAGPEARDPGTA